MAENEDLQHFSAVHKMDENENPSLNSSSSVSAVNDSFKIMNSVTNLSADSLISAGLSTSQKNALIDSGFHCENLEKTVLPELVNNSLCESVDNEFADVTCEEKQVSGISFCSNNDNSINESKDASFNVIANTTTNNIALLFERLTLNSEVNTSLGNDFDHCHPPDSDAVTEANLSDNHIPTTSLHQPMPSELSPNENCKVLDQPSVPSDSNISKLESPNSSLLFDKNLQQPSHVPESNEIPRDDSFNSANLSETSKESFPVPEVKKVPFDETFTNSNQIDMSHKTNSVTLSNPSVTNSSQVDMSHETNSVTLSNPSVTNSSQVDMSHETNSVTLSNPSVTNSNQVDMSLDAGVESVSSMPSKINKSECPFSSETSIDDIFKQPFPVLEAFPVLDNQNATDDNVFAGNSDENFDGEEFQDAVQFFKDPSSFQVFETTSSASSGAGMPRGSLYMTFDPLYKRVVLPEQSSDDKSSYPEEENTAQHVPDRTPLGSSLVSFDSPVKRNSVGTSEEVTENFKETMKEGDDFDMKFADVNQSINKNSTENLEGDMCGIDNIKNDQQFEFVNKNISFLPARESLVGNLLSFDSPMKSNSARNSANLKASNLEADQKLYTEEEFQQALKIFELTMQESFLKKQREIEEEALKKQKEIQEVALKKQKEIEEKALEKQKELEEEALKKQKEMEEVFAKEIEEVLKKQNKVDEALKLQKEIEEEAMKNEENLKEESDAARKLHQVTELCKVLLETVSELAVIATEQNAKIGDLSSRILTLESENQKLESDLKTSSEDLQSVEHTFSDFHKRYEQCKGMLKSYKENEDRLKSQVECLNKRLEEQEQVNSMLHAKMEEVVDKANAEVATAKKGGDAQLAVLKAQLKKSELKVSSLESDLKQVRIENDKLSSICDDLMAKVSEA